MKCIKKNKDLEVEKMDAGEAMKSGWSPKLSGETRG